jgi:hypothetical protein
MGVLLIILYGLASLFVAPFANAQDAAPPPVPEFKFEPPKDPENPDDDPPWIYGMHDPNDDCVRALEEAGVRGWFVEAIGIGRDPNDTGGRDWSGLASRGIGVICRIDYGFGGKGTIPQVKYYEDYAKRCANFVAASRGCRIWVIGNETNLAVENPHEGDSMEVITPENYAKCFLMVRKAIKALPGREKDQVVLQALSPWNDGRETGQGDWLSQFRRMMKGIGSQVDGFALHVYSLNGHEPGKVKESWFQSSYRDILKSVPKELARLPVYVTECGARAAGEWQDANNGWVKAAMADIHAWNQKGAPKIRAVCLYRWGWGAGDPSSIGAKRGVFEDWKDALKMNLHWTARRPPTEKELKAMEEKARAEWERKQAAAREKEARAQAKAAGAAPAGPAVSGASAPAAGGGAVDLDAPIPAAEKGGTASGTVMAVEAVTRPGVGNMVAFALRMSAADTRVFCVLERDAAAYAAAKALAAGDILMFDYKVADKLRTVKKLEKVGVDGSVKK